MHEDCDFFWYHLLLFLCTAHFLNESDSNLCTRLLSLKIGPKDNFIRLVPFPSSLIITQCNSITVHPTNWATHIPRLSGVPNGSPCINIKLAVFLMVKIVVFTCIINFTSCRRPCGRYIGMLKMDCCIRSLAPPGIKCHVAVSLMEDDFVLVKYFAIEACQ